MMSLDNRMVSLLNSTSSHYHHNSNNNKNINRTLRVQPFPIRSSAATTTSGRRTIWANWRHTSPDDDENDQQQQETLTDVIPHERYPQERYPPFPSQACSSSSVSSPIRIHRSMVHSSSASADTLFFDTTSYRNEAAAAAAAAMEEDERQQTCGHMTRMYDQRTWDMYRLITNARRTRVIPQTRMVPFAATAAAAAVTHVRDHVHVVYDDDDEDLCGDEGDSEETSCGSSHTFEEDMVFVLED